VAAWATFDASTVGNLLEFGNLTTTPVYKLIQDGDTPSFAASQFTRTAS
jgi:hypothetical protein